MPSRQRGGHQLKQQMGTASRLPPLRKSQRKGPAQGGGPEQQAALEPERRRRFPLTSAFLCRSVQWPPQKPLPRGKWAVRAPVQPGSLARARRFFGRSTLRRVWSETKAPGRHCGQEAKQPKARSRGRTGGTQQPSLLKARGPGQGSLRGDQRPPAAHRAHPRVQGPGSPLRNEAVSRRLPLPPGEGGQEADGLSPPPRQRPRLPPLCPGRGRPREARSSILDGQLVPPSPGSVVFGPNRRTSLALDTHVLDAGQDLLLVPGQSHPKSEQVPGEASQEEAC